MAPEANHRSLSERSCFCWFSSELFLSNCLTLAQQRALRFIVARILEVSLLLTIWGRGLLTRARPLQAGLDLNSRHVTDWVAEASVPTIEILKGQYCLGSWCSEVELPTQLSTMVCLATIYGVEAISTGDPVLRGSSSSWRRNFACHCGWRGNGLPENQASRCLLLEAH